MANTETPTSQGLAKVDNTPRAMIQRYQDSFAAVLPSHITRPETWIRLAQGALKKGKRVAGGRTELEIAADANPGVFLAALLDCARLGLEPGTDEYYLTARKVKGGGTQIQGIVGYQGYVELMFRAGAVSSVVVEVVYSKDRFEFRPGRDEVPLHEIDWDAADRGDLRLAYAFARMKDGGTSKVVVLNRTDIERIKSKSDSAGSQYSPWQWNEPSMWLKSAARQLRKWVPTSAEYRRELMRSKAEADDQRDTIRGEVDLPAASGDAYSDDDEVEAEIVDEPDYADSDPERPF